MPFKVAAFLIFLCGHASAIPVDPAPGVEEQGKARVILEYITPFRKALADLQGRAATRDTPPYDIEAFAKAKAEQDRKITLCKSRAQEFQTEAAYVTCFTSASLDFGTAIAAKDTGFGEALTASLTSAAADADAGKLTRDQAHGIYDILIATYEDLVGEVHDYYASLDDARLAAEYNDRFLKSYRPAGAMKAGEPPFDDDAEAPALDILTKAREACKSRTDFPKKKAYADCIMGAEKRFTETVQLRDSGLYTAFMSAMLAAAGDADAQRLTSSQLEVIFASLEQAYSDQFEQQLSSYHLLLAKPVATGYAVRFVAAYVAAAGSQSKPTERPYDQTAELQALHGLTTAAGKCQTVNKLSATQPANVECYIAAYHGFAVAIRLLDMRLFETFAAAMRIVAADTKAGRLTEWQESAAYNALVDSFSRTYRRANAIYLVALYKPLARQYVMRLDNDYILASGNNNAGDAPPWDLDISPTAKTAGDQAAFSCLERQAELKTHVAYWDCRAAAWRTWAAAIHTRNMLLLEKVLTAIREAANDADSGKITSDQFDSVSAAISLAYDEIGADAWNGWRIKHEAPGLAP